MYVCMYVCMYVRTYVRMYACMHVCKYVCMYVCMYVSLSLSIYIYIYMSISLSIYIYIHTHVASVRELPSRSPLVVAPVPPNEISWEHVNNMCLHVTSYYKYDQMSQNVATRADLKQHIANREDLWPFCENQVCPDPVWKTPALKVLKP